MAGCQVYEPGCGVQGKEVTLFVAMDNGNESAPVFRIAGPSRTNLTYTYHEGTSMYDASFVPYFAGKYELAITINEQPVQGSPFIINVKEQEGFSPPEGDASKVKASGDGLRQCVVDQPAFFTLHTSEAGFGKLHMEMEGPSEALMSHEEEANEAGTFRNEYVVQEAGQYSLRVLWSGEEIPESPFSITATSAWVFLTHKLGPVVLHSNTSVGFRTRQYQWQCAWSRLQWELSFLQNFSGSTQSRYQWQLLPLLSRRSLLASCWLLYTLSCP